MTCSTFTPHTVTDRMKMAAALAIAEVVSEDELLPSYIIEASSIAASHRRLPTRLLRPRLAEGPHCHQTAFFWNYASGRPALVNLDRYSRQIRFPQLGEDGQRRLLQSRVLLCGCGALGTVLAETLTRAGVGFLRVVDRDFVEASNLQRQVLFDEEDIRQRLPKSIAAARELTAINSDVTIEPVVADVDFSNIRQLADGVDLILDGTDNFEIRFLINDLSLKTRHPVSLRRLHFEPRADGTDLSQRMACLQRA